MSGGPGSKRGGIGVLKVGGAVTGTAVAEIRALAALGPVVVVHGGGPQISAAMARAGLEVAFVHGRRVTDEAAVEVVREALLAVNAELCAALGPRAVGLAGDEIGLEATRVPELGFVGTPLPARPQAVLDALAAGLLPVVTPLARGPLNVNADEAAAALAVGLGADRILFVTDVPGVLRDEWVVDRIHADEADRLVEDGTFEGGIVPKLVAAVRAARQGVRAEIGATEVVA
jgi:acetylglutamate kinase